MLTCEKIDETYSIVKGDAVELRSVYKTLSVEEPSAYFNPLVKIGYKDPCVHFAEYNGNKDALRVFNGHLQILGINQSSSPDYSLATIQEFLHEIIPKLPFKPYDFQLRCAIQCIMAVRKIAICCTGSGKSLIISLILEFFRQQGKRSVLIVPNINLLTQFKSDIDSYGLSELSNSIELLGDGNHATFTKQVCITTWQSFSKYVGNATFDVCIADECHRISGDFSSLCISALKGTKYRFGFTGTMPDDEIAYYRLTGLFAQPERFIRAKDLIERGLGTPIKIKTIIFNYLGENNKKLRALPQWNQKLKFIKEFQERNEFITKLATRLQSRGQNSLVLFSHTQHGKDLFTLLMNSLFPGVEIKNSEITGKKSFEFQSKYNVYFINGEDDSKTREQTRKILEERPGCILVANYALLSTGVNIKQLNNLIFASPLKAYTTITQSIGRGIRKCDGKTVFTVYDLVDNTGIRRDCGIFMKQYLHRVKTSYEPEGYPISQIHVNLGACDAMQDMLK